MQRAPKRSCVEEESGSRDRVQELTTRKILAKSVLAAACAAAVIVPTAGAASAATPAASVHTAVQGDRWYHHDGRWDDSYYYGGGIGVGLGLGLGIRLL
ncbi:hypothetical protein [Streptomyces sp. NPDC051561]|uniref:hypothetical protein n=1 Tax=Streptomyces sp. NPDC051561 TaxID=3365658 RepID=UPI0037ADA377